jgi:hypothetical protein
LDFAGGSLLLLLILLPEVQLEALVGNRLRLPPLKVLLLRGFVIIEIEERIPDTQ